MGFSVTAATAILFAAAFISLATLLSGYSAMQTNQSEAERFVYQHSLDVNRQGIQILDINGTARTISMVNRGTSELATYDVDVVVNGTLRSTDIADRVVIGVGNTSVWFPGETLILTMNCSLAGTTVLVYAGTSACACAG